MKEENGVKTDIKDMELRKITSGYIRFSIKADDTKENTLTHEAFREFCRIECDNNYTLGIRKLLEYYQSDFKYEMLSDKIMNVEQVLYELKTDFEKSKEEPKKVKEEANAF